ncbi:MAG: bifunctional aspartate kinase/homoserine dehydrogenase I [Thermotogota bacterium]|nr:bifunctional aspartate kinase/homoserine dehydrogenase I [Thermotogota bacterium]
MKVMKFGGTSLSDADGIQRIAQIILEEKGDVIVCSAFSGITNELIDSGERAANGNQSYKKLYNNIVQRHQRAITNLSLDHDHELNIQINEIHKELEKMLEGVFLLREFSRRTKDLVMSFGEKISSRLLTGFLKVIHKQAEFCDSYHLIYTDEVFGNARIKPEMTSKKIIEILNPDKKTIKIIPGFTGRTDNGVITTLGRGGSDLTATFIGSVLRADEIQIWTDVNGFMSADPIKVKDAFSLDVLSYDEALELSYFGAKVLLPHSIRPAKENGVPIIIKNTFDQSFKGTRVSKATVPLKDFAKGITSIDTVSLINITGSGMVGVRGISARIFRTLAENNINAILISQASSEQSVCVAVQPDATLTACNTLRKEFQLEMMTKMIDEIEVDTNLSIIAVVGDKMRNTPGVAGRIFNAFGENGVNVVAIAQGASELNISIVISNDDEERALNSLHNAFFTKRRVLNLVIAGKGLIGTEFIKQLKKAKKAFLEEKGVELRVISILDSTKMLFDPQGINLNDWKEQLIHSNITSDTRKLLTMVNEHNIINTVFVDCTASEKIADSYISLMQNRISVVAANKIANTKPMSVYEELKQTANQYKVHFLYETNAGAGLPIIDTIRNLKDTGDKIKKFEAILSGTISYLFNQLTESTKFSDIVKKAKDLGYTEPDPRIDLSGVDFARKILLLVRESGIDMELDDINIEHLLSPHTSEDVSIKEFYRRLEGEDEKYTQLVKKTKDQGFVIRWIGKYEDGRASIKLEWINNEHPFFNLNETDNIIAIYTKRYTNPLVIKGAGAGAEVTAGGVMSDVFRIANALNKRWDY